jgi:uncharacterized protein (TIGR01777 family)
VRIGVTGSTGLVGTRLVRDLRVGGDEVVRFVRPETPDEPTLATGGTDTVEWDPARGLIDRDALEGLDAVVHLAGVGIGDSRWTHDQKRRIVRSRVDGTTLLATTLASLDAPPKVLLSASAVGYYGDTGDRITSESGRVGHDFTASVCRAWEAAAVPAETSGIRVAYLRSGVVQAAEGGALAKQLPFFKWGLGGRFGSGKQYISWITLDDEIGAIRFLLDNEIEGPVNLVAPEPATNEDYTKALGRVLRRPTTVTPMLAPRLMFGRELADSLLLTSQRVVPGVLTEAGYTFQHAQIEGALRAVLGRPRRR